MESLSFLVDDVNEPWGCDQRKMCGLVLISKEKLGNFITRI